MGARVVLLSKQTLLAEGIMTLLQQHVEGVEFLIIEGSHAEALTQVAVDCPLVIFLDDGTLPNFGSTTLGRLLQIIPTVRVIRLDTHSEQAQIIDCELRSIVGSSDLVDLINQGLASTPSHAGQALEQ